MVSAIPGVRVENGQDVLAVYEAVEAAVERARSGDGPSLVEVMTYRFNEHSEGLRLSTDYRDADEKERWLELDPIVLFRTELESRRVATDAEPRRPGERGDGRGGRSLRVQPDQPLSRTVRGVCGPVHRADRRTVMVMMSYLGAIGAAQREAMDADSRVIIMGEDVEANVYGTTGAGKSRAVEGDFLQRYRTRADPRTHRSQRRLS